MEDMPSDILPEASETEPVVIPATEEPVSEDVKPPVSDEEGPQEDAPPVSEPTVPSGHVPYSRFKEEVKKRKEAEDKLKTLEASSVAEEEATVEPDGDDDLRKEVRELKIDKYVMQYPELNDKRSELDEFMEENSELSLDRAVTLFRAEHGLLTSAPTRKGLEKVNAGPKTAPKPKWTLESIDELRTKDEKQWEKRMSKGEFDDALAGW